MKYKLTLLFVFSCFLSQAQLVPSSCTAPDSVRQLYRRDAQGLALDRIVRFNSVYEDSTLIPDSWADSVLGPMMAVYNATHLPARDSVIKFYKVHSNHSNMTLKGHNITIDKTVPWVADIKAGVFPTRNDSVNKLMLKYGLHEHSFSEPAGDPYTYIYFRSDSSCNVRGLDSEWNRIYPMDVYANVYSDGPEIFVDMLTDSVVQLRYRYACGDCPSGCTVWRDWTFRVYKDCSVEYIGSKGDKIEGMDCIQLAVQPVLQQEISVYPNPFDDKLIVKGMSKGTEYSIIDVVGQVRLSGFADNAGIINTSILSSGIYFIRLKGNDTIVLRAVKN